MKIFLSWAGDLSKEVALSLRDWLPMVLQSVKPYVSAEDIPLGARWNVDLSAELLDTGFGITCVTRENVATDWINFEAGALSRTVADKTRVVPMLIDLPLPLPAGPLAQFQAGMFTKPDVLKLLRAINAALSDQVPLTHLELQLEKWWPDLERAVEKAKQAAAETKVAPPVAADPAETLKEILEHVRQLARARAVDEAQGKLKTQQQLARRAYAVFLKTDGLPDVEDVAEVLGPAAEPVEARKLSDGSLRLDWRIAPSTPPVEEVLKRLADLGLRIRSYGTST